MLLAGILKSGRNSPNPAGFRVSKRSSENLCPLYAPVRRPGGAKEVVGLIIPLRSIKHRVSEGGCCRRDRGRGADHSPASGRTEFSRSELQVPGLETQRRPAARVSGKNLDD